MQKYMIMIVDGNEDIRDEISNMDWAALDFEIAAVAENGNDALELVESVKIDVFITDIELPVLDGLTMISKLRKSHPYIKTVIITALGEFKYVREAIRLGVADYISKPVNTEELTEALIKIKRELNESVEQKRRIDALAESYEKSLPVMRERFLNELIRGSALIVDIESQLDFYRLPLNDMRYKTAIVFEAETEAEEAYLVAAKSEPVIQFIGEMLSGNCINTVFTSSSAIVAITCWDYPGFITNAMEIVNNICAKSVKIFDLKLTAGIGHYYDSIEKMADSYKEAKSALKYKTVAGSGKAIYIDDVEQNEFGVAPYDNRGEERLFSVVKYGSEKQIAMLKDDIFNKMSGLKEWERQAYMVSLLNELYRIVGRYELDNEASVMNILDCLVAAAFERRIVKPVNECFFDLCLCMSAHIRSKRDRTQNNMAKEAKRYIDSHYHERDLSIERLCAHLHVSQSYFSTVFKKETGVSFVQYLTELRMTRAITLLDQTDDKTYTIAGKVGYDDPNYFNYVFKKRFGISPAKYRK